MLVLSRKRGQTIEIGDDIIITIVDLNNVQVRIGIDAPDDVAIKRDDASSAKNRKEFNKSRPIITTKRRSVNERFNK